MASIPRKFEIARLCKPNKPLASRPLHPIQFRAKHFSLNNDRELAQSRRSKNS